jgi:alkylhydroperoxidase family enzyme
VARIPLVGPEPDRASAAGTNEQPGVGAGVHPNIYRAMANHPEALRAFGALGRFLYAGECSISASHRELAYLTASVANRCHY